MGLLDTLLQSAGGGLPEQLGRQVGLDANQTKSAMEQLLPAIAGGLKQNTAQSGGLDSLLGALNKGNHDRYLDNPEELTSNQGIDEGNAILGHIFGSKDVSRQVASRAQKNSGIDAGILKKLLPMLATAAMGSMSKQSQGSGGALSGLLGAGGGNSGSLLSSFLDKDGDGSIADDLLGMAAGKFFGR